MSTAAKGPANAGRANYWAPLALIGLLATVAGLVMPQLLPEETHGAENKARESANAAGDLHYVPPELPQVPSTRAMFLRLGGMTVVVLVLCVGVLVCGKRWMRGFAPNQAAGGKLALVETLQLGNRCSLHLVQLSSRQVLVGADATGLKTVVPLPDVFENCLDDTEQQPRKQADAA
jgi:flagellar biogenesis protein FliO